MGNTLYVIVPCYNEEECLNDSANILKQTMLNLMQEGFIKNDSKILFVNDGSSDKTWDIITNLHQTDKLFSGLSLSRNRGHQNACFAGLSYAYNYADMLITIDADLQDDVSCIRQMVLEFAKGYEVVYGVRSSRKKDSFFKRFTAQAYYKLLAKMGIEIVYNHADCRLMSKRATEALLAFGEVNLFLRGMVPQIGYKSTYVTYPRFERTKGKSKYSFRKMLSLAWNGITSFSVKPLKLITFLGTIIFFISFNFLIVFSILFGLKVIPFTLDFYIIVSIWLATSLLLIASGLLGEYIGKIHQEVKHRPRFFIEDILND